MNHRLLFLLLEEPWIYHRIELSTLNSHLAIHSLLSTAKGLIHNFTLFKINNALQYFTLLYNSLKIESLF